MDRPPDDRSETRGEKLLLDAATTFLVGGSMVCLLGVAIWPGVFMIPAVIMALILVGLIAAGSL